MHKRRKNRDLAQTILSRRYIPLEDKVFVEVLCGLFLVFFGLFHFAAYLEQEALREKLPYLAQQMVQSLPENTIKTLPVLDTPQPLSERHLLFRIPISSLSGSCRDQTGECLFVRDSREFTVIHDASLSNDTALALDANALSNQNLTFLTDSIFPSAVAAALALTLFLRLVFRRKFFASLDIITKTVFARKVFAATGGIAQDAAGHALDGRIHFFTSLPGRLRAVIRKIDRPIPLFQTTRTNNTSSRTRTKGPEIQLVRQPDYPRIPLERFANDEFGQLALALEDEHARELRYEQLLPDLLESLPFPAATISKDRRNIFLNARMRHTLGKSELPELPHPPNLSDLLQQALGLPAELTKRTLRVLDQSLPRMDLKEFSIATPEGTRSFPVSVSSLNKFGKRIALIIIHEDSRTISSSMLQLFTTTVNRQVELIQELETELEQYAQNENEKALYHVRSLHSQVNLVSEILQSGEAQLLEEITFNAPALIQNVIDQFSKRENLDLRLSETVPTHVCANPSHLRQFLFLAIREISRDSGDKTDLIVNYLGEQEELSFSLTATKTLGSTNRETTHIFLTQLAKVYGYATTDLSNNKRECFIFKTKAKQTQTNPGFLFLDTSEKLEEKHLLVIEQNSSSPLSTLDMIHKIRSKRTEIQEIENFIEGHSNRHRPDVVLLLANSSDWNKDPRIFSAAKILRNAGIPTLLVSNTPRRGEYAEARALGFNGYLRRPFSNKELQSSLVLLSSPEATSLINSRGLITRHTIHELTQEVGTALIAEFDPHHRAAADRLAQILSGLSIKSCRVSSNTEFFEEVSRQLFSYIFYPSDLTPGLRRQIGVNLHGRSAICYEVRPADERLENPPTLPQGHQMVRNPENPEEVLRALRATATQSDSPEQELAYTQKSA